MATVRRHAGVDEKVVVASLSVIGAPTDELMSVEKQGCLHLALASCVQVTMFVAAAAGRLAGAKILSVQLSISSLRSGYTPVAAPLQSGAFTFHSARYAPPLHECMPSWLFFLCLTLLQVVTTLFHKLPLNTAGLMGERLYKWWYEKLYFAVGLHVQCIRFTPQGNMQ